MTAKTEDGKEIYNKQMHYHPQATTCRDTKMTYGAQWKTQYIRDTSLQPRKPKKETIEIDLPKGVRTADVTVDLFYELVNPSMKFPIQTVHRKVTLDR
ncbi:MAG: hypothetical protein AMK71_00615 [Nitrospira bacterium SG8_35_4]|nr:MAG: hypothetical protein AMK71_00615 [Nitrospira bacterium SG8_35_4]